MTSADRIWNRAALKSGGEDPRAGDRALAALLLVHGLVLNGGVQHALESVQPTELSGAVEGFAYFGLDDVVTFFRGIVEDPVLSTWTDDTELGADRRYAQLIPSDSYLVDKFEDVLRERPDQFAPVDVD